MNSEGFEMETNIKKYLICLGFILKEGTANTWHKRYPKHDNYEIKVFWDDTSLKKSKIDYGDKIAVTRGTTSNFSQKENQVVLECVNRLLEIGYKPGNIVLEKSWKLGRKSKGYLDILVTDKKGTSFLMVDCKTWGGEYIKEKKKMIADGGQLFSYLMHEPDTEYICLYCSRLNGGGIEIKYDYVRNRSEFLGKNLEDIIEIWDKNFGITGIFEDSILPYQVKPAGIKYGGLRELESADGGLIFNQFAEILRRYVISDKTNAFNKIFNLFLCKIVDEDEKKGSNEQVDFQWLENDDFVSFVSRLNDLYKKGVKDYLDMEVTDYSEELIDEKLNFYKATMDVSEIKKIITELRLYKDNQFAFIEVYNKETFEENAVIVKTVVELLQPYKIRYVKKQQYLGDFFEQLLNTGIKQEAGQFFTPIPLTQFICRSLPLEEIIEEKNVSKEIRFLPYVIDFASGSGHFLTEIMDLINIYVEKTELNWIKGGRKARDYFESERENYLWVREYVYGIEKDYRLAKTTKISTFLNGDGEATVITGDGLDNFYYSDKYPTYLKTTDDNETDLNKFDIVISNPPYAVDGFKNTLKHGDRSFSLYKYLTENSSEIECLFVERVKQLLRTGGCAGIILPSTLLTNAGIHERAREIILTYFEVEGMLSLGENAFMATTKSTVIFFLRKKSYEDHRISVAIIDNFFKDYKDVTCSQIPDAFTIYVNEVYPEITFDGFISLLKGAPSEGVLSSEMYEEYQIYYNETNKPEKRSEEGFFKTIRSVEKEKILYFVAAYNKPIVVGRSGGKKEERSFLGYKFSERKGKEGIEIFKDDNGFIDTKLFSECDLEDSTKINSYILNNYRGALPTGLDETLHDNVDLWYLNDLINFRELPFRKRIFIAVRPRIISSYKTERLDKLCAIIDSGTTAPTRKYFENGSIPFIRAGNLNNLDEENYVIPDKDSLINDLAVSELSLKKFGKGTIVFPKSGQSVNTNNIGILREDSYVVNHLACLYDDDANFMKYLFYLLKYYRTSNLSPPGVDYPTINISDIKKFRIPKLPDVVLEELVVKIRRVESLNAKDREEAMKKILREYWSVE